MLRAILIFVSLICVINSISARDSDWETYKAKFGKVYTPEEDRIRYGIWKSNVEEISRHNEDKSQSFQLGLNIFSDKSEEELRVNCKCMLNETESEKIEKEEYFQPEQGVIADTINWAEKGLVTEVKEQTFWCGSCYSFGACGALEGQWYKKTGKLASLSEQQIVDCSDRWGNHGCHGGLATRAWQYIKDVGGIVSEKTYPYTATKSYCHKSRLHDVAAKVKGYKEVKKNDEGVLKSAVAQIGPIAVSIDASRKKFRQYTSGVYDDPTCSSKHVNHAVLLVGYGVENGKEYWLIKNSWGTSWGLNGYGKMSRNKGNQCAIASNPAYPLV